jgi:hypothetical protein
LRHGHHTGRAAGDGVVDPVADRSALRAELGEDDADAVFARHPFDAADDLHSPDVFEFVEDEFHQVAAAGRLPVPVPVEQRLDSCAGVGGHARPSIEDLGHRRDRHARRLGDVGDRHRAGRVPGV